MEPEFSVLHGDKEFEPEMSGYDKKRFCNVYLNCGKVYLPDSMYHFTTNCRKNTKKLINKNELDSIQINWINSYHKQVFQTISKLISTELRNWLKDKTRTI